MASGADPLRFVTSSSVRTDVLLAVAEGSGSTVDVLDGLDASSSAIYDALGRLEDAGLLRSGDDGWQITGSGRLVVDFVRDRQRLGTLLSTVDEYFAAHDPGDIPAEFRRRTGELSPARVIRADDTAPQAVVREVSDRLERSERAQAVSPVYDELYRQALPDPADSRLVLDGDVVDAIAAERTDGTDTESGLAAFRTAPIRVTEVNVGLLVLDDTLLLSLPLLDGTYDARAEFVAEHERARQWGLDVFEAFWADAVDVEDYLADAGH